MKLRMKNTVTVGFAFLTVMLLWQVYNWVVPLYLESYLENFGFGKLLIGIVMGLDNLFAVFMIPLVSKMSDNCKSKIGKRTPFILFGLVLAAISFMFVPLSNSISMFMLVVNLLVVLVAMNIYRSPAVSLMPDITPKPLRSRANAIINIMGGVGAALGYALLFSATLLKIESYFAIFATSVIMTVCLGVILIVVNEKKMVRQMEDDIDLYIKQSGKNINEFTDEDEELEKLKSSTKGRHLGKADRKNFVLVLASVFFYYMATNAFETFMSLFSSEVYGNESFGLILTGVLFVSSFLFMWPAAAVAEKFGKRKTMLCGAVLMSASIAIAAFFTSFSMFLVVPFLVCGIGMALMISNMYPLVVEFCKKGDVGKYTGHYYTSTMVAQSITPALIGLLCSEILFGSMKPLLAYSAFFMGMSALVLFFVGNKEKSTKGQ